MEEYNSQSKPAPKNAFNDRIIRAFLWSIYTWVSWNNFIAAGMVGHDLAAYGHITRGTWSTSDIIGISLFFSAPFAILSGIFLSAVYPRLKRVGWIIVLIILIVIPAIMFTLGMKNGLEYKKSGEVLPYTLDQ